MNINVVLFRPHHGTIKAFVIDESGKGSNLLANRGLTDFAAAKREVESFLSQKGHAQGIIFRPTFFHKEGDPLHDTYFFTPGGKKFKL